MPQSSKKIKLLSVVVPAYRQEKTIVQDLKNISGVLQKFDHPYEIIVVVDGLVDKTHEYLKKHKPKYTKVLIHSRNQGKGQAVRYGLQHAKGDVVGFLDAGMDLNPEGVRILLSDFQKSNADIVIGSKRHPKSNVSYPFKRMLISKISQRFIKLLFGLNVTDTQVGMKFFKREVIDDVLPRLLVKKFAFDIEMLCVAYYLGYHKILEAPIDLQYNFQGSILSKNIIKELFNTLWDTCAIFYRLRLIRYYDKYSNKEFKQNALRILILNWRDIKNPSGGGAEILTHELAKRWVAKGHTVTQFCAAFPNAKPEEVIDGVTYVRRWRWWNVHILAYFYYVFKARTKTDIIIDEVHWFPFFTALYAKDKTCTLVCEVANKLFYTIFPKPIAFVWRSIEKFYLKIYQNIPAMTISPSTQKDLIAEGHNPKKAVVIPLGITYPKDIKIFPKEKSPTCIYVARLNKQKGIYDTLKAFAQVHKEIPRSKLWVVGSGSDQATEEVQKLTKKLRINKAVQFYGFVSEKRKFELLSRAHILISASVQEGWGLTIPEAGFVKTPSVVYNTQGFRDIVETEKNGILTEPNPAALATGIIRVFNDKSIYSKFSKAIYIKAQSYSWENASSKSLQFLKKVATTTK